MIVEILRVYEDYVTKTMFTLTESLLVLVEPNFKTDMRNIKGRTECLIEVFLNVCGEEERWHVLQNPSEPPFLRSPPHSKPFSNISDQANKLLEHLQKASGKQASLPA